MTAPPGRESPAIDLSALERDSASTVVEHANRPDRAEKRFGLYFLPGSNALAAPGKAVEVEVFWEHFKNDQFMLEREYGRYDTSSTMITVIDHVDSIGAGTIRVITEPSEAGLRTLEDFRATPEWGFGVEDIQTHHGFEIDSTKILDIATLAVRRGYRSGKSTFLVSLALYHGLYLSALLTGKEYMIGALDDAVVDLQQSLGVPWERACGCASVSFMGSPSTSPVILRVEDAAKSMMQHSDFARSICTGEGLDDQLSLPPTPITEESVHPPDIEFGSTRIELEGQSH